MKKVLFLIILILLFIGSASANNYGSNIYGCGLFGEGCSDEVSQEAVTSSGGGGGSTQIQFDVKILEIDSDLILGEYLDFSYYVKGVGSINHDVTIDFWIENSNKTKISSGSDVIYFGANEEKTESASLLIPEGIESGIYVFKVKASYNSVTGESHRTIQLDVEEGKVKQLFDISMFLEEKSIKNSDDLTVVITFENFGDIPTKINLTYLILDRSGREIFSEEGSLIVGTEGFLRKGFLGLNLPEGKYTFRLETLYGDNVYDEFDQNFEIKKSSCELLGLNFGKFIFCWYWGVLIVVIIGLAIILFIKRRKKKKENKKNKKSVGEYKKKVRGKLKSIKD